MSICPEASWESYSYQTDKGMVVSTFYTDANKIDKARFPFCARVIINIKNPNERGGPANEEAEELWAMEDQLVALLDAREVQCMMIGRLTHSGRRELIFQVADFLPFRPPVGRWMKEHSDYETDVSEHEGWNFFFESVWPSETSWMLIMDKRVVENLIRAGSDPSKLHSLEFVFQGEPSRLSTLQAILLNKGYSLVDFAPTESRLVMAKSFTLHLPDIYQESIAHRDDCAKLGVDYDGWGASSVS